MDFAEGQKAFCFEPDPTKARVLYEARILSCFTAGSIMKKKCYKVHFLGWNNSWDRVVPETHLLPFNEDNKKLKKTLELTIRIKNNRKRKRKINEILKTYFGKKPKLESDDSGSESSENEASKETVDFDDLYRSFVESQQISLKQATEDFKKESITPKVLKFDMPARLKLKLREDSANISRKKKVASLPAKLNLLQIFSLFLESCSKNMVEDIILESLNGIRIIFDNTFSNTLLYKHERPYWEAYISDQVDPSPSVSEVRETRRSAKKRFQKSPTDDIQSHNFISTENLEELRKKKAPSTVCGCIHFLRIFTSLPQVFTSMRMSEEKQKRAVEILGNLLR
ncbi:DgyrCDS7022 [Dimorphilus gyrociliatus]|uniref:DgyrCDS7022 n=1 Tax=Dimorphilus gyrociliatus TaxID=2664684 RepID=A0A7I8VUR6_9ANNE|nr:DgyrCDS7022 [Dimorphilus gyrociliatus]